MNIKEDGIPLQSFGDPQASLDYVLRRLVPGILGSSWSLVTIILLFL